jgi:hypothetical protein
MDIWKTTNNINGGGGGGGGGEDFRVDDRWCNLLNIISRTQQNSKQGHIQSHYRFIGCSKRLGL